MWERFGGAAAAKQGIFSIPRGQDPPPTPFQTVAAVGASQWKSFSKSSLNAAGGPQLTAVIGGHSAPSTRTTASLAPSLPPRWLIAVPQVSSKPKKTPWQRGADSVHARGTLREPNRRSIRITASALAKAPSQVGGGRQGKSRLLEKKVFPCRAGDTPGATRAARLLGCQPSHAVLPASRGPSPPRTP